ncbi:MAG: hypothetical protein KDB02_10155 [Acidimicrobiales bacterium]|nr:hypothetical protein [Acidimicrobiales bacterium]
MPEGVEPIVSNLAFGSFSVYVVPQVVRLQGSDTGESHFVVLPAGTKPSADNPLVLAGGLSEGVSPPQETEILSAPDPDSEGIPGVEPGPLGPAGVSLTYGQIVEKKGGQQGAPPSSAPAGKAAFVVDTALLPVGPDNNGIFFFVDESCSPPVNGDGLKNLPDTFVSNDAAAGYGPYAFFPVDAGSHKIAFTGLIGTTVPTCDQIKPTADQETSVSVETGDTVLVLPYGVDKDHVKIATAVID